MHSIGKIIGTYTLLIVCYYIFWGLSCVLEFSTVNKQINFYIGYVVYHLETSALVALTIDECISKLCFESISRSISVNQSNFAFNLKHFEYDARFSSYNCKQQENKLFQPFVLPNIQHMVNLETLKLRLAFPEHSINNDESEQSISEERERTILENVSIFQQTTQNRNKLNKLETIDIMWDYTCRNHWGAARFRSFFQQNNNGDLDTSHWNRIMSSIIEYILFIGGINIKTFVLKCPQWTHDDLIEIGSESIVLLFHLLNKYSKQLEKIDFAMDWSIYANFLCAAINVWVEQYGTDEHKAIFNDESFHEAMGISMDDDKTKFIGQVVGKLKHLSLLIGLIGFGSQQQMSYSRFTYPFRLLSTMMRSRMCYSKNFAQLQSLS